VRARRPRSAKKSAFNPSNGGARPHEIGAASGAGEKATAAQRRDSAEDGGAKRKAAVQKNDGNTEERRQHRRTAAQRDGTGRPAAAKNPGLGKKFRPKSLSLFPYG
jgi:hypothetical protein